MNYNIDFQHTEKWFIESLRELLHSSVLAHLKSDVEVGAYISGGVDSLIAALARGQAQSRLQGFNGRFAENSFMTGLLCGKAGGSKWNRYQNSRYN